MFYFLKEVFRLNSSRVGILRRNKLMLIKLFFILVALLFCSQIVYQNGYKKLLWFAVGILFFPNSIVLIEWPILITVPRLLIYTLFFTIIVSKRGWWLSFKTFPLKTSLLIIFLMLLLVGLFDARLNLVLRVYRPVTVFVENFSILFISYFSIRKVEETLKLHLTILLCLGLFGVFGIVNYFQHENIYYLLINRTYGLYDYSNVNMTRIVERLRVSSFAWHAIYYGLLLVIGILLSVFLLTTEFVRLKRRYLYFALVVLLIINLFLVNSRTPIFALMTGFSILFIWRFNLVQRLRITLGLISLLIVLLFMYPKASNILNASVETVWSQKSNYEEGSSPEMRMDQLRASLSLFLKRPIFGNGIYYITESLGYNPDFLSNKSDNDLHGFESYAYLLFIEQGLLGIIANLIFSISLFVFFVTNCYRGNFVVKVFSIFTISLLVTFFTFILATGDMGSFTFIMMIIGVNIKTIVIAKRPLNLVAKIDRFLMAENYSDEE